MTITPTRLGAALLALLSAGAAAEPQLLDTIVITGGRPSSLPTQIPTTIEGITARQIEATINATDSEDALKYLPSLLVRKRFIGDYNHAVLSTRASGTGNSARSMVYADGILLSNFLGNGAGFTPRWGLVTPEEIERVDVLYGPFSAAYAGNSVGAVVDYVTRMPTRLEMHAKLGYASQQFDQYSSRERVAGKQASASTGNKHGKFAWWINANRLDSNGQPLSFATRTLGDGSAPAAGTPAVSGAIAGKNPKGQPWWLLGTTTSYHTVQDHAKLKLAYDVSATLRASYTLGLWHNDTDGGVNSYLRDGAGQPVYAGNVAIEGRQYRLNAPSAAFAPSLNQLEHRMQGFSLKSTTRAVFDWEASAGLYDYHQDVLRAPTTPLPGALAGGAGRVTDMQGTGWRTLSLRGVWRPARHVIEFGYQQDDYRLRSLVSNTGDWIAGAPGARFSSFSGNTALKSVFAQQTWTISDTWKSTLGGRLERWHAYGGELGNASVVLPFGQERSDTHFSPKAALAYRMGEQWVFKASAGRALRMPTVGELYQGSILDDAIINTNPALRPEASWTGELSAERAAAQGSLRATLFVERTRDALYSQALTATVSTVQNIDAIRTKGIELAWQRDNAGVAGLDLNGSVTYTDSVIAANAGLAASVGKRQPRVPRLRASAVASYRQGDRMSYTLAARYSGRQYGQLDNSDSNGFAFQGFSKFFVVDARVRAKFDQQWSAAVGIDNLNNYTYWAFHPYPKRTVVAELKYDW
jgi:iron complex outermembrane receptor protein